MPELGTNRDYDTLRPTYPAEEHSLPFRTIFQEYRVRRRSDIEAAVAKHVFERPAPVSNSDTNKLWADLDLFLAKSEDAYSAVAAMKEVVQSIEQRPNETDEQFNARRAFGYKLILQAERHCRWRDRRLKKVLHDMEGTAVCLSGGGIRSASFSLGVLQGLARFSGRKAGSNGQKPLLKTLDYLSTVSGGGYIGSWLMAWAKRSGSYERVVEQLATPAGTTGDPEPQPIRHLREYTNYLSPRLGFTLDTLTLVCIVVRNMALNWLIIVPVAICLFCLPRLLWIVSYGWALASAGSRGDWTPYVMMGSAIGCVLVAAGYVAIRSRWPAYSSEVRNPGKHGSSVEQFWWFAVPMVLGGWLLGEMWLRRGVILFTDRTRSFSEFTRWYFWFAFIPPLLMSLVRLVPAELVRWIRRLRYAEFLHPLRLVHFLKTKAIENDGQNSTVFHEHDEACRLSWPQVIGSFFAPMVVAVLTAMLLAGLAIGVSHLLAVPGDLVKPNYSLTWFPHLAPPDPAPQVMATKIFVVLGLPVILLVLMLSGVFLSGLLSQVEREQEREWWARGGALLTAVVVIWIGLNAVAFFAQDIVKFVSISVLAALGFCTGYVGSLAGLSAVTTSGLKRVKVEQLSKGKRWLAEHNAVASVASAISLVCIALTLASFTIWLCGKANALSAVVLNFFQAHPVRAPHFLSSMIGTWQWENLRVTPTLDLRIEFISALVVFAGAAALAALANWFINVNTFSLHGMYRMRLTRAFLGASNFARHPDAFL
jgi:Patatin-like phospholipase